MRAPLALALLLALPLGCAAADAGDADAARQIAERGCLDAQHADAARALDALDHNRSVDAPPPDPTMLGDDAAAAYAWAYDAVANDTLYPQVRDATVAAAGDAQERALGAASALNAVVVDTSGATALCLASAHGKRDLTHADADDALALGDARTGGWLHAQARYDHTRDRAEAGLACLGIDPYDAPGW